MTDSILIVDDNADAANAMKKLLTLIGYTVSLAYSGEEALEAVRIKKPKVMLLDIRMPEMDGYEVAKELRADPSHTDIALVALTGFGQDEDKQKAESAGFNHHLTKPASLNDIRSVLDRYFPNNGVAYQ
jgi:CheY-like chemotaxis protein